MKFIYSAITCLVLLVTSAAAVSAEPHLRLATTTSTENSGLLTYLLPSFEAQCACKVDVIAVGTGKALKLGEMGDVDVVLVHARQLEDRFVAEGFGVQRHDVMFNDFVLLGPESDPAAVSAELGVAKALAGIAASESVFVSRGDRSGTHHKEKQLWQASGVKPSGTWYLEAGRGMGEVIIMAGEHQGYTLADRGTYIAMRDKVALKVQGQGDARLFNPYGVIAVNPEKHPHVQQGMANQFIDYLTSEEGRDLITTFRKNGEQLFFVSER